MLLATLLTACTDAPSVDVTDPHDRYQQLTRDDYIRLRQRTQPRRPPEPEAPIPQLQPVIDPARPGGSPGDRLVSLTVTDTVPLKDVLIELARDASVNLELDPRISGGIVFSAQQQPLRTVMRRLSDLAGLRYKFEDEFLRIELDEPYHETYRLDYISLIRTTSGSISIATNVFQAVGAGSGGAGNNSVAGVQSTSVADFWAELETNLSQILENASTYRALAQPLVAVATEAAAPPVPALQPVVPIPPAGAVPGSTTTSTATGVPAAAAAANPQLAAPGQVAPPQAPSAVPGADAAQAAVAAATAAVQAAQAAQGATPASQAAAATQLSAQVASEGAVGATPRFSVNRQAGIISVYASSRTHVQIADYLTRLKQEVASQVLIEARIIEVTLTEDFRSGINWTTLFGGDVNFAADFDINFDPSRPTGFLQVDLDNSTIAGDPLTGLVQLISSFGTVRTLSSPRITLLNNQTAILKVAENQVYFTTEVEATPVVNADGTTTVSRTLTSTVNTVPIGVVMTVQPAINTGTEEVTLTLRPTISRVVNQVADPAVTIVAADAGVPNLQSLIPVVEVREIDSVLKMQSSDVAILGGLMQDRAELTNTGVPVLKDVPFLGNAFKSRDERSTVVELVILLRATIGRQPKPHEQDIDLYRRYNNDPRPIDRR